MKRIEAILSILPILFLLFWSGCGEGDSKNEGSDPEKNLVQGDTISRFDDPQSSFFLQDETLELAGTLDEKPVTARLTIQGGNVEGEIIFSETGASKVLKGEINQMGRIGLRVQDDTGGSVVMGAFINTHEFIANWSHSMGLEPMQLHLYPTGTTPLSFESGREGFHYHRIQCRDENCNSTIEMPLLETPEASGILLQSLLSVLPIPRCEVPQGGKCRGGNWPTEVFETTPLFISGKTVPERTPLPGEPTFWTFDKENQYFASLGDFLVSPEKFQQVINRLTGEDSFTIVNEFAFAFSGKYMWVMLTNPAGAFRELKISFPDILGTTDSSSPIGAYIISKLRPS